MREAIGPFDREHAAMQFLESQIVGRGTLEAIQVGVIQRQAAAAIFMNECERRAADLVRIQAKPRCQPSNERGLPCSEIPRQQQDITRREATSQIAGHGRCLCF